MEKNSMREDTAMEQEKGNEGRGNRWEHSWEGRGVKLNTKHNRTLTYQEIGFYFILFCGYSLMASVKYEMKNADHSLPNSVERLSRDLSTQSKKTKQIKMRLVSLQSF